MFKGGKGIAGGNLLVVGKSQDAALQAAEKAVEAIKSGDHVAFAYGLEPLDLAMALIGRSAELKVRVLVPAPGRDLPWYDPGWEDIFQVSVGYILPMARKMIEEKSWQAVYIFIS